MKNLKPRLRALAAVSALSMGLLAAAPTIAQDQDFVWAPDFPVGSRMIEISAEDQNGDVKTFNDLKGREGLVFILNRSFDWCPYCVNQLMQFVEAADEFEELGFKIAAITYDSVDTLKEVEEDRDVPFPLLHDEAVTHVDALGIRNPQYAPGHRAYGIPLPGVILIGPDGVIHHKFAEARYQDRTDLRYILAAADSMRSLRRVTERR